ncbi:MAG: hypothetical protein LBD28_00360 [Tannerellaceae bacterium]|jgi:hypothetical protein|nr:hypothetical protein [Tannerellaceae bacterium]
MAKRLLVLLTKKVIIAAALTVCVSTTMKAQAEFEITPSADLVSSYVWRGMYQTGASFQPSLNLSYGAVSLGFWGSTDFASVGNFDLGIPKEFDITLGLSLGSLSVALVDYWWAGEGSPYGEYKASHFFEAALGYSFGSFSLGWNTMLWEANGGVDDYEQQFSTFITAAYDFSVKGVLCSAGIGISPWTGMYHAGDSKGLVFSTISLKASKEIKLSDSFSLPVFAEAIVAPNQDNAFLVFGISL